MGSTSDKMGRGEEKEGREHMASLEPEGAERLAQAGGSVGVAKFFTMGILQHTKGEHTQQSEHQHPLNSTAPRHHSSFGRDMRDAGAAWCAVRLTIGRTCALWCPAAQCA